MNQTRTAPDQSYTTLDISSPALDGLAKCCGGTVNLASSERGQPIGGRPRVSSSTGHRVPNKEGAGPQHPVVDCPQQVTPDTKEILGDSVHRQELLRLSRGFEPSHSSLPLSGRLVRDFCPIVRVSAGLMDNGRHDRSLRGGIAPQLFGCLLYTSPSPLD